MLLHNHLVFQNITVWYIQNFLIHHLHCFWFGRGINWTSWTSSWSRWCIYCVYEVRRCDIWRVYTLLYLFFTSRHSLDPRLLCFKFLRFPFFFFIPFPLMGGTVHVRYINSSRNFWPIFREQCIHALFTDPQISFFINFFIKSGSHSTIHLFKNYFATVFSVFNFQFQQNKFYPNRPQVWLLSSMTDITICMSPIDYMEGKK